MLTQHSHLLLQAPSDTVPATGGKGAKRSKRRYDNPRSYRNRWAAIAFLFVEELDTPAAELDNGTTVPCIQERLGLTDGAGKKAVQRCIDACREKRGYGCGKTRGPHPELNAVWAEVFHDKLRTGYGGTEACSYTNALRMKLGHEPVAESTYQRAAKNLLGQKTFKTGQRKDGSNDPDSKWARARLMFATQLCIQLEGSVQLCKRFSVEPLSLHQILWVRIPFDSCVLRYCNCPGRAIALVTSEGVLCNNS